MPHSPANDQLRATLVRALEEVGRLRTRVAALESQEHEPIAIVGVGLRMPGGIVDLASLWRLLDRGVDAVARVPADRWDADAIFDEDPDAAGKSYVREAAFLDHIDRFDPGFFGISPREARSMDPQHRLLLETAWEALERAAIVPASLIDSRTGVFVGLGPSDYGMRIDSNDADTYAIMGTQSSFAAGRLAFHLGLQGPALTIDTACSSALVATHLACQSLRVGECTRALVGAAQIMAASAAFVQLSRTRALARDGRSKTFSANADGYGRGEGALVFVLERLADARARQHSPLALIRGSAVNHDGPSSGITAPNGTSQQKVLRAALADARLVPGDVSVVECHGTGTSLGDPIEVNALAAVYGQGRPADHPLRLGAIKTNVGHLEAASGLASIAKLIVALEHGVLPATLHTQPLNPHIDWARSPVVVVDRPSEWARGEQPRRAGVSAFGLSGTNAHIILEEPPAEPSPITERPCAPQWLPMLLSARSDDALIDRARDLRRWIDTNRETSPLDLAASLALSRSHFEKRIAIPVTDLDSLAARLDALLATNPSPTSTKSAPQLAFLFSGQGSQRSRMGWTCHREFPVFRESFDTICTHFDALLDQPLREIVFAEPGSDRAALLDQTVFTQAGSFAIEVALFRLLQSWGVRPDVVLGHSIGELAAAHVAGVWSLDDACKLVAARGRSMQALPDGGAMVSLQADEAEVRPMLTRYPGVDIAAINGPMSTVVSGDERAVFELASEFERAGRKVRRLEVSHAFHSSRMEPMLAEFRAVASSLAYARPQLAVVSNVTGRLASADELTSPEYWVRHVRSAVRFLDGVRTLEQRGVRVMVELGPQGVLTGMVEDCLSEAGRESIIRTCALRRDRSESETLIGLLGELHCRAVPIAWPAVFAPYQARIVALPTYPFRQQRCWLDAPTSRGSRLASAGRHSLAGHRVDLPDGSLVHQVDVGPAIQRYLADHLVYDHIVVPGAFHLAVLLAIAASRWPDRSIELSNVEFVRALTFADERAHVQLTVSLRPADADRLAASISTRTEEGWVEHATATLAAVDVRPSATIELRDADWQPARARLEPALAQIQVDWGARWWWLQDVQVGDAPIGRFTPPEIDTADAPLPAGLIDNSFALLCWTRAFEDLQHETTARLPHSIERLIWSGGAVMPCHARFEIHTSGSEVVADIDYLDASGRALARVEGFRSRLAPMDRFIPRATPQHLYRVAWLPTPIPAPTRTHWSLVGADPFGLRAKLGIELATYTRFADLPTDSVDPVLVCFAASQTTALEATHAALGVLQEWLRSPAASERRLIIVTQMAIACELGEHDFAVANAGIWGLIRSAQSEQPDRRITLVDIDTFDESLARLPGIVQLAGDQFGLRRGEILTPRLRRVEHTALRIPETKPWRLEIAKRGALDGLELRSAPETELGPGDVRVAMRAAAINFRDVLNVLDMYPGDAGPLGGEGSGVVLAIGDDVHDLRVGDRVMGVLPSAFSDVAVTDARRLLPLPDRWSWSAGASACAAYLTAFHGLVVLARVQRGERVLIHAAAGGVGLAAVLLAKHLGAEVFATASPSKWPVLRELGIPADHIASSRTLEFERQFSDAAIDVVLNSLAFEFTDASLRLMSRGGRFLELGKTDRRDPARVAREFPGIVYSAFDLAGFDPEIVRLSFAELGPLFANGVLPALPRTCWDLRHAREAFRHVSQAKHVGKVVLRIPFAPDPAGTVLVTGGTGGLGAVVVRQLASRGFENILIVSRRGMAAEGATAIVAELESLGVNVSVVACDASEIEPLQGVIDAIPSSRPLTAVYHLAGVLDDGVIATLDEAKLASVFTAKVTSAVNLSTSMANHDLAEFVVFSSFSAVIGAPGQANYAAANSVLDLLCEARRNEGLCGTSLNWGAWADVGMAANLSQQHRDRVTRQGFPPLTREQGMSLLTEALARPESVLVPVRIDAGTLAGTSAILEELAAPASRKRSATATVTEQWPTLLTRTPKHEREATLTTWLAVEVARVLGIADPTSLAIDQPMQDLGLDSLTGVELRNRIASMTGMRLPSTLAFDHPTMTALAHHLLLEMPSPQDSMSRAIHSMRAADRKQVTPPSRNVGLLEMIQQALAQGHAETAQSLIATLASLRRQDTRNTSITPVATRLSQSDALSVYAIPSLAIPSTPLQFLRLAAAWEDRVSVWSASNPGYDLGERLVDDAESMIRWHAEAAKQAAENRPLLLLGYSSGGWVAADLAAHMQREGIPIAGLILLDPPAPRGLPQAVAAGFLLRSVEYHLANIDGMADGIIDRFIAEMTAMVWNMRLWDDAWRPPAMPARTLYVQAKRGFPGIGSLDFVTTPNEHWAPFLPEFTIAEIDADHFELVTDALPEVLLAIDAWLEQ